MARSQEMVPQYTYHIGRVRERVEAKDLQIAINRVHKT